MHEWNRAGHQQQCQTAALARSEQHRVHLVYTLTKPEAKRRDPLVNEPLDVGIYGGSAAPKRHAGCEQQLTTLEVGRWVNELRDVHSRQRCRRYRTAVPGKSKLAREPSVQLFQSDH